MCSNWIIVVIMHFEKQMGEKIWLWCILKWFDSRNPGRIKIDCQEKKELELIVRKKRIKIDCQENKEWIFTIVFFISSDSSLVTWGSANWVIVKNQKILAMTLLKLWRVINFLLFPSNTALQSSVQCCKSVNLQQS